MTELYRHPLSVSKKNYRTDNRIGKIRKDDLACRNAGAERSPPVEAENHGSTGRNPGAALLQTRSSRGEICRLHPDVKTGKKAGWKPIDAPRPPFL